MRPLAAILFDIDDTLYSTTDFVEVARAHALEAMLGAGLKLDRDRLSDELREIVVKAGSNYEHHFDELLSRLPAESYDPVNPALIISAGVIAYHDTKMRQLVPYEDAVELIKSLSQRGSLLLGAVSAGVPVKQAEKILRLGLDKYFAPQAVFITEQMGLSKADGELWQRVCAALEVEPGATMYVGDNPPNDVDGPNSVGMLTTLVRRGGKYKDVTPRTQPDFTIEDFWDLRDILEREFGI